MRITTKKEFFRLRVRSFVLLFVVGAVAAAAWGIMIRMPSDSYDGAWTPLSPEEEALKAELVRDVEILAGEIGDRNVLAHDNYLAAADHIENELRAAGYDVRRQTFEVDGRPCHNLEAERTGRRDPGRILVLGAHYDSVTGTPGANDNASGVAALLAIARALATDEPEVTLRFVAFANEEPPYFHTENMGSRVYARECRTRGDDLIGLISLETIGYYSDEPGSQHYPYPFQLFYPREGNFIGFVGNVRSRHLVHDAIRAFRENARMPSEGAALPAFIDGVGWSDQWAFWQEGYPGIMVTDTAPFRYPHYHTTEDTTEKLDYPRMTRVVDGLTAVTRELAGVPGQP